MLEYTFSLANFEILILILVRISCFVYIAPFFGTKNAPSQAKIGFSFFVALLVYGFVDKTAIEFRFDWVCDNSVKRRNYRVADRVCCKHL